MKASIIPLAALLVLAGCASTRLSDADRLALYRAHAGEPVKQIRYFSAMGWDRIDDEHVVIDMRPNESWLLRVSGTCLEWAGAAPSLRLSSSGPNVVAKFDRIHVAGAPMSCRIEEIRRLDLQGLREAQREARAQASSGT